MKVNFAMLHWDQINGEGYIKFNEQWDELDWLTKADAIVDWKHSLDTQYTKALNSTKTTKDYHGHCK